VASRNTRNHSAIIGHMQKLSSPTLPSLTLRHAAMHLEVLLAGWVCTFAMRMIVTTHMP
jgi:hypothetical protein